MEDDAKQFIEELEARFGAPVGYRTYSTWFASNEGIVREFGVFVYEIGGVFHFEDFERKPSLFGFSIQSRKNKPAYVKMEGAFALSDIESLAIVSKAKALACAEGHRDQQSIEPAAGLQKLFRPLVTRVVLRDGTTYFFELINHKQFTQIVEEGSDGSVQGI